MSDGVWVLHWLYLMMLTGDSVDMWLAATDAVWMTDEEYKVVKMIERCMVK